MMKLQSAVEYLVTYGWALVILAGVVGVFYALGFFNPGAFQSNQCIFPADFSCLYSQMTQTGNLLVTVEQASPSPINITAYGCNQNASVVNMVPLVGANQIYLPIGSTVNITVSCYTTNSVIFSGPVGSLYKGYMLINYTSSITAFPHTIVGQIVEKAV